MLQKIAVKPCQKSVVSTNKKIRSRLFSKINNDFAGIDLAVLGALLNPIHNTVVH